MALVAVAGCGASPRPPGASEVSATGSVELAVEPEVIAWRDDECDVIRVGSLEPDQHGSGGVPLRFGLPRRRWEPGPRTHFLAGEMYAAPTPLDGDRVLVVWRALAGARVVDVHWTDGRESGGRTWRDAESERYRRDDPSGETVRRRLGPPFNHGSQSEAHYNLVVHRFRAPSRRHADRLLQVWEAPSAANGIIDAYWASAPHVDRAALAPPGPRVIEPQDSTERAAALDRDLQEMDALRKGFDTPVNRVEVRGRTLLRKFHSAEEHAQIYFQLAHIEGQSGFQHPDKAIWYVERALEWPPGLEKEKRILLYHYWGNALEAAHEGAQGDALSAARRQIVEPYLKGLNDALEYKAELQATPLPEPPPERDDLPGADNRALAFPELARAERERLLERIADLQHGFVEQIAYLYSRPPGARKELRELAGEVLSDKRVAARLMARVDARIREEGGNEPRGGGGGSGRPVPASSPASNDAARRRRNPPATAGASGPALIRQLIDAQIEQLQRESTAESIKQLWQVEMYYWPGYRFDGAGGIALPLAADVGTHWVDQILSSRRFLKVFDELSRMPPAQAADLIDRQVRESLPIYRDLLVRDLAALKRNRPALPPGTASSIGITLQISNNPDATPTLNGVRLQLLSLALVAGNLKLTGAAATVRKLVEEAESQRAILYQPDPVLSEADRFAILADASLYQRQILATALLGVAGESAAEPKKSDIDESGLPYRVEVLPRYDAHVTRYDRAAGAAGGDDPANAMGELRLRVLEPIADEQWQRVLKPRARE